MNELNILLDIILICSILYVAYRFTLKIVKIYLKAKVRRSIYKLKPMILHFTQDDCNRLKQMLDELDARTDIYKKLINDTRLLIKIREEILNG